MRARGAAIVALGVAAAFLLWLGFAVGDRAEPELEVLVPPAVEETPAIEPAADEVELDLDSAPALEAEEIEATRVAEAVVPEAPAITAIAPPAPDTAVVRGLLRDAATGEPLPVYSLRIQDSSMRWEDVMTDESGRFATGSPMVGGTIRITPFDDPGHKRGVQSIAVEWPVAGGEARDLDVSVASGPTYRLAITPADAAVPTTFVAFLRVGNVDEAGSVGQEPVRAGEPPWVRFAPVPKEFDRCDRLEIRDKEGLWMGSAKASALGGVVPGIVEIVLDARAVLLGKAVDLSGNPVPGASLVFEGVSDSGKAYERKKTTRFDGQFRMEYVAAGSGTLSLRSLRHVEQAAAIRLQAGAVTQQDFILAPLASAGAIRGRVESETGDYEGEVEVVLRPLSSVASSEKLKIRWESKDGRRVGVFEFEALPAGEYEIAARSAGWLGWEPNVVVTSPPSEVARFVVRDAVALADFAFRARDAETGAAIDTFAWWNVPGGASSSKRLGAGERFLIRFPLERDFRWRLDRQGYRPKFGDEKAFAVEEPHRAGVWKIAEVELEPGWGEVFRVIGRGNKKPVEGAKVLLDGREAGTTNKDGRCTVSARERPKKVEIAYRDWRVVSSVDLRPAWRRKEKRFVEVQVAPPAGK